MPVPVIGVEGEGLARMAVEEVEVAHFRAVRHGLAAGSLEPGAAAERAFVISGCHAGDQAHTAQHQRLQQLPESERPPRLTKRNLTARPRMYPGVNVVDRERHSVATLNERPQQRTEVRRNRNVDE